MCEQILKRISQRMYGTGPYVNILHHQWLATTALNRDILRILSEQQGTLLDVGCGRQPYRHLCPLGLQYFGADLAGNGTADFLITDKGISVPSGAYDVILCTQVLQFVPDVRCFLVELRRCLRNNGMLILSAPFIFNEHRPPVDYHRFSRHTWKLLAAEYKMEVLEVSCQGGVFSSIAILFWNWLFTVLSGSFIRRLLRVMLLPVLTPCVCVCNLAAKMMDTLDNTGKFYGNAVVVLRAA